MYVYLIVEQSGTKGDAIFHVAVGAWMGPGCDFRFCVGESPEKSPLD